MFEKLVYFGHALGNFGHKAVIDYCNRPFRTPDGQLDVDAMNQAMIDRWNERVGPQDTVFHLGDFAMGPSLSIPLYRRQLNGRIVLVRGNHDRSVSLMRSAGFDEVVNEYWTDDGIWMRHIPPYPSQVAALTRPCRLILCGHKHHEWLEQNIHGVRAINVGVDKWGFRPSTLEELLAGPDYTAPV